MEDPILDASIKSVYLNPLERLKSRFAEMSFLAFRSFVSLFLAQIIMVRDLFFFLFGMGNKHVDGAQPPRDLICSSKRCGSRLTNNWFLAVFCKKEKSSFHIRFVQIGKTDMVPNFHVFKNTIFHPLKLDIGCPAGIIFPDFSPSLRAPSLGLSTGREGNLRIRKDPPPSPE